MSELWLKLAVNFPSHPKVIQAGPHAAWLAVCGIAYCREHLTDGEIPAAVVPTLAAVKRPMALAAKLVEVGLWEARENGFYIHDFLEWNPSREEVKSTREWGTARKALYRDKDLTAFIRERDQNQCRYCGIDVNWSDRRGPAGGQFDHVIPRGPSTAENVVVACRECNVKKNNKPINECGLKLRPEPVPNETGTSSGINVPYVRADAPAPDARSASDSSVPLVGGLEGGAGETTDVPPVWREPSPRPSTLIPPPVDHRRCYDAPAACRRGYCLPKFLGKQWEAQLAAGQPEGYAASAAVVVRVNAIVDATPAGTEVPDTLPWWRAQWAARRPAPKAVDEDWFDECERLHNGECGGRYKHGLKMADQIAAFAGKAVAS